MAGGLNFSIANNAEMFLKMGDLAKAAEMAEKGIVSAERAALRAEKKLGAVDPAFKEYIRKLESIQTKANAGIGAQQAIEDAKDRAKDALHEAHVTEKLGSKFQRVFGGSFMQKLLRGEPLDFTDGLREAKGMEKFAEKALRSVGIKSLDLATAGIALTVGVEAVEAWKRAFEQMKKDKEDAEKIGKEYGMGLLSKAEFDYFQGRFAAGAKDASKELKDVQNAADAIGHLDFNQLDKALQSGTLAGAKTQQSAFGTSPLTAKDIQIAYKIPNAEVLMKDIDKGLDKKQQQLGGPLSKETQKEVIREILVEELKSAPQAVRESIVEAIMKAENEFELDKRKNAKQKPLFMIVDEQRQKQIYEVAASVMDKRVPPMPND